MENSYDPSSCPFCKEGKVPVVNEVEHRTVYHNILIWWTLAGFLLGALIFGTAGYLTAEGTGIKDLGQFYSAGTFVAVFTASSLGAAFGGLGGGIAATLQRLGKSK